MVSPVFMARWALPRQQISQEEEGTPSLGLTAMETYGYSAVREMTRTALMDNLTTCGGTTSLQVNGFG
jgi:hypothetical protein